MSIFKVRRYYFISASIERCTVKGEFKEVHQSYALASADGLFPNSSNVLATVIDGFCEMYNTQPSNVQITQFNRV